MEIPRKLPPQFAHKLSGILLFVGLVGYFCIKFYTANLSQFPAHVHAWSQSDRYALALNFQKNGFHLFHPQTFALNPQFPPAQPLAVPQGITQVDCPLHEYAIATIMGAVGSTAPGVFRLYNLLYGILGLFFLFLLVRNHTQSHLKAFAVVVFALLSPVWVYYMDGFLPSTTSVASALVGLYFYVHYTRHKRYRDVVLAALFLLLAALSRLPFALFLGSVFCGLALDSLKQKKLQWRILLPFAGAFAILGGYFVYNRWMAAHYGSVFLTTIHTITNWAQFRETLAYIYHNWFRSYFTAYHYLVLAVFALVFVVQWIRTRRLTHFQRVVGLQFLITSGAATVYFVLMIGQFHSHDYYFLDSFYIPALLFLAMCIDSFKLQKTPAKILFALPLVLFVYAAYGKCQHDMAQRYTNNPNDRYRAETENYQGAAAYLDSLGVSPTAKILVMDAYTANIPFILMNRSGYNLMGATPQRIAASLSWNVDYVTMQNEFILSDVVNYYPNILNQLQPVGTNGRITVFRKQNRQRSLAAFLLMQKPVLFTASSCPTAPHACDSCVNHPVSCDSLLQLNPQNEYADVLQVDLNQFNTANINLFFSADCLLKQFNANNTDMVVAINQNNTQVYYKSFALNQYLDQQTGTAFRKLYFMFPLKNTKKNAGQLKLYLWNNGKNAVAIKNICVWLQP